jgi:hypothetical protein
MIRASGDGALDIESARQAWATWLVGVLVVYGVLPRLLLTLFCFWRWNSGKAALRLDLNLPGYAQLRERLMPTSERLGVNDAEPAQLHRVESSVSEHSPAKAPCWSPSNSTNSAHGRPRCRKMSATPASSTAASHGTNFSNNSAASRRHVWRLPATHGARRIAAASR